jgi:hypothetical protein
MSTEVAEKVETTETVVVAEPATPTEAPTYVDSEGEELKVGAVVRLSDDASWGEWDDNHGPFGGYVNDREVDFGTVAKLNSDGTVQVQWDGCGCFVDPDDEGRAEKTDDLTVSNDGEREVYWLGFSKGRGQGEKDAQQNLRNALGLK